MSGITIPTLDEITGHTVMAKLRSLCKRFIGLAEEVDEKIDAPLEEAHLVVETANTTLATAQESLEDAQSAVTTANSASATANEASESAQESASTVAGYDTRLTAVENGKINITDINDYAIGLTGNQSSTGVKKITNSFIFNRRLTATGVYELCRFPIVSDVQIYYQAFTRYSSGMGKITITTNGVDTISGMSNSFIKTSGTDGTTTFYTYIEDNSIVLCVGNASSTNNYISVTIHSGMYGAGLELALNIEYVGTSRVQTENSIGVLY